MTSSAIDIEPIGAPSATSVRPYRHRLFDGSRDANDVGTLVRAAASGDQYAWNHLVDEFASTVWAIARGHRLNSADAADVFQTTWLRLLEHLDRIEQPERAGAWIATTARRECLRMLRISKRQVPRDDFDFVPDPVTLASPDRNLVVEERRKMVSQLVDQLPTRSRMLLRLLSADSPLSYKEISEALSMPIGSIGPSRQRALEQLRRLDTPCRTQVRRRVRLLSSTSSLTDVERFCKWTSGFRGNSFWARLITGRVVSDATIGVGRLDDGPVRASSCLPHSVGGVRGQGWP